MSSFYGCYYVFFSLILRNDVTMLGLIALALIPILEPFVSLIRSLTEAKIIRVVCWVSFLVLSLIYFIVTLVIAENLKAAGIIYKVANLLINIGMFSLVCYNTILERSFEIT